MYRKIVIIGNPIAGGARNSVLRRSLDRLLAEGIEASLILTQHQGDAASIARTFAGSPDTLIIAAGGDGTYNEIANGLAGSDTPMAILPLGTTSVLARELGIPLKPEKALDVALGGKVKAVRPGIIERDGKRCLFLLMAGIGFDGEAVYRMDRGLKTRIGRGAYILSGLRMLLTYAPVSLKLHATMVPGYDRGRFRIDPSGGCRETHGGIELTGYTVIVSKAACYGGSYKITPYASLDDPDLHVFVTHRPDRTHMFRTLAAIVRGTAHELDSVSHFRTTRIRVEGSAHIQIDGDYAGTTPAAFSVTHEELRLVVPA